MCPGVGVFEDEDQSVLEGNFLWLVAGLPKFEDGFLGAFSWKAFVRPGDGWRVGHTPGILIGVEAEAGPVLGADHLPNDEQKKGVIS